MQILNSTFNCIAVWLLLKYSPFHKTFKYLLVLGYFVFFEYNVVARNYSLFMLLLFFIAIIYESKEKKKYSFVILLLLLAFTHFFGLVLSILIFIYSVITQGIIKKTKWLIPILIGCIGYLLICFLLFRLPNEASLIPNNRSFSFESIIFQLNNILDSLLLITSYFYSYDLFYIGSFTKLVISSFIFFGLIYYMIHNKKLIFILIIYLISIFIFRIFIYSGGIWNIGVIWLAIIFLSWISPNSNLKSIQSSFLCILTFNILIFHSFLGFKWIYLDINYDFSLSKKYANFINGYNNTHPNLNIYFNTKDDWLGESIVPYLDNDIKIYGLGYVPVHGKLNTKNCLMLIDNNSQIKNRKEIIFSLSGIELRGKCNFLIKKVDGESGHIEFTSP